MEVNEDLCKDRGIRLIDFLTRLNQLRTKVVRDLNDYQNVLWLHEIPSEQRYCFTRAWGDNENFDPDIWIEIKKYNEPKLERVPEICEKWADQKTLRNTDDFPKLLSSINIQVDKLNPDWDPKDPVEEQYISTLETLNLDNHPKVSEEWDRYLETKWLPWSDLHRKWQEVQNIYSQLFSIYQQQQKLGEEFELVLAIGLLNWKPPTGHSVRRHLITSKADIIFDSRVGKFTVKASVEGPQLTVELDMLELGDQPKGAASTAEAAINSSDQDPWNRSTINPILSSLTNTLSDKGDGEYYGSNLKPTESRPEKKPIVDYSPAVILRKRSLRGLSQVLQTIRKQIVDGATLPPEFIDIVEGKNLESPSSAEKTQTSQEGHEISVKLPKTIFFPLPYNEEQKEIINRLDSSSGILVQGPPGTGKSHTIANLICHFLATGKRILITAQTPRALKVLHEKLPKALKPICISLLGSGIEEMEALKDSVSSILNEQYKWNEANAIERIKELDKKNHLLKSQREEIRYRLRSIRELETRTHILFDGAYNNTAAKIGIKVREESPNFNWFKDEINYKQEMPISKMELVKIRSEISSVPEEMRQEIGQAVPAPGKELPSIKEYADLISRYKEASSFTSKEAYLINSPQWKLLSESNISDIQSIILAISKLNAEVISVCKRPMKWIEGAVYEMLTDNDTPWKEMLSISLVNLKNLREKARKISDQSLSLPKRYEIKKVLADAKILQTHLEGGGKIGWGIFRDKIVKERMYLIEEVKINGLACDKAVPLELLEEHLDVLDRINNAWKIWEGKVERKPGPPFIQFATLEELQEALNRVVELYDLHQNAKEAIYSIQGLAEPTWHIAKEVIEFHNVCQFVVREKELKQVKEEIGNVSKKIQKISELPNAHPVVQEIIPILKKGDPNLYSIFVSRIEKIIEDSDCVKRSSMTLEKLEEIAPLFIKQLYLSPNDPCWEGRLNSIEKAWDWARAKSWLRDFINADDVESLIRQLERIDQDVNSNIAELSANHSWKYCFKRMSEQHRRSLIGWQDNMRSIGKGTGKHAPKYRREAQRHLNECKGAIPAWIMPLHKVWDTVKPTPGIFDVIIVDEASQCGWQSIPLLYMGKRIIIVGDDQQISPQAVGLNKNSVQALMDEYLYDFEHSDSFDAENSLFGHARRRFSAPIVLREHFRCMPEIIRFSNDLCYKGAPLIPLRQYPPKRLKPLISVHISDGYREGSGEKAINRNEAEALVKEIIKCCKDERYAEKTMGVICLQGKAQAALIEKLLLDNIENEGISADELFKKRRLICGDSYSFQGDERHVIFLSMIVAPNEIISAMTKPDFQKRFNVAASRAQDQMWLFHTPTANDLNESCLRRKLLDHFTNPQSNIDKALGGKGEKLRELAHMANRSIEKPPEPFESWFELDVALQIAARGYRVIPQYSVIEKKRIDLVIEGLQSRIAVECDGDYWHGPDEYDKDAERQRKLERCGWTFYRIRESAFNYIPEETMNGLYHVLEHHGIHPVGSEGHHETINKLEEEFTKEQDLDFKLIESDIQEKITFDNPEKDFETNKATSRKTEPQEISLPRNIQEALVMKLKDIGLVIVEALGKRPNETCVRDKLVDYVLKELKVRTRAKPREDFNRKVINALKKLETDSVVEIYKSKNIRVRLR